MTAKLAQHQRALHAIRATLRRRYGLASKMMPITRSPFDLLVGGKARVEIKTTETLYKPKHTDIRYYTYHVSRHNELSVGEADFFVLRVPPIRELGMRYAFYLVVPANEIEHRHTVHVTPRNLLTKWAQRVNQWQAIREFCR